MSSSKVSYNILFLRLLLRLLIGIAALAIVLVLALPVGFYGMALYLEPKLPSVDEIKRAKLEMPLHIYSHDNKLIGLYGNRMSLPITFEEIPEDMVNALLAAEDSSFFEHSGISVKGLGRAVTQLLTANDAQTGGSTITMQVAKNYFLSSEQTFERKITELFLSRKIESKLSKSEILTLYVNKIYLGEGSYGIKAAAKKYFSKSLSSLTVAEHALLAGLPKAPSAFNPVINPERALIRRNWILGRMLHHGYISQDEYDIAITTPLNLNLYIDEVDIDMPYIAEMARYSLVKDFGNEVMNSGWRVRLTINSKTQKTAHDIVRTHLKRYDSGRGWHGVESKNGNLKNFKPYLNMRPAKVTEVNTSNFKAELKSGEIITVPWHEMSWARNYRSKVRAERNPRKPDHIVNIGNIVRVSPKGNSWKLVQAPEVQGSLVSINPESGAIIALVGGYHYYHSKFNRATNGFRQPGSTIKPLVYSAALAKGYRPDSLISDSPLKIGNWKPKNSDGRYYGPMELRRALYLSRNLVSIRLLRSVGTGNTLNLLQQFGLDRNRLPNTLSLALGAGGASPLQMATAYSTFANGGHRIQPYLIEQIYSFDKDILLNSNPRLACAGCFNRNLEDINKNQTILYKKFLADKEDADLSAAEKANKKLKEIVDLEAKLAALEANEELDADKARNSKIPKENKPIDKDNDLSTKIGINKADATAKGDRIQPYPVQYDRAEQATRIISPSVSYEMAGILRDVIRIGTAKKARSLGRSDIGGKTGTTNNFKDAWFAGFQKHNATVVWIGFDQPRSLGRGQFGGKLALPVWIDFMRTQLKGRPIEWVSLDSNDSDLKDKADKAKDKKKKKTEKKEEKDNIDESLINSIPKAVVKARAIPLPKTSPSIKSREPVLKPFKPVIDEHQEEITKIKIDRD